MYHRNTPRPENSNPDPLHGEPINQETHLAREASRPFVEEHFLSKGFNSLPFGIHQPSTAAGPMLLHYPQNTHVYPVFSGGCIALVGGERFVSAWGGSKPLGVVMLESCTEEDVIRVVSALGSEVKNISRLSIPLEQHEKISTHEVGDTVPDTKVFSASIPPMMATYIAFTARSVEFLKTGSSPESPLLTISL